MSEYQYYEFRAIDRPLSKADKEYLRSVSSRAEISASSFVNVYTFGGPSMLATNVAVTTGTQIRITITYPFNWLTPLPRLIGWTQSGTPMTSNLHAQAIFKQE